MLRIISYECQKYWRAIKKRQLIILSLEQLIDDRKGNTTELIETLADDRAIKLKAWLEARTWLLCCPRQLEVIACKRVKGISLTGRERDYLSYHKRKEMPKYQKALI